MGLSNLIQIPHHHVLANEIALNLKYSISLKYLFDQHNLNARHRRWLSFLREYDFEIKHIKEK